MAEQEDLSKLSTDDKLAHKVWKARQMGYEEVTKLFRRIDDEDSPEYSKYVGLVRKFPVESNAFAQEKALEATLAFAECASAASKICSEVIAGVVTKCLNARPKTKELGINVCLMYVEIEKQDTVLEEVMKGLQNKQPKIVLGSVQVILRTIQEFGARVLNLKLVLKTLPSIFEHTDKTVRAEVKSLVVELFKHIGAAVKLSLEGKIKPVQMKELEEEFAKVTGGPPVPPRLLRSQQKAAAQPVAAAVATGGGGGGGEAPAVAQAPAIDPFDLIDPIDMLSKMPKDFFERIADTKWKERKEVLEAILPLAQSPKLEPGDYGDLLKALKKVITKDSNVMVVALAGNVVTGLAKGLRKKFQPYASVITAAMFEKFKEKKLNVVTSLREAVDAVYLTTSAAGIQDECIEALGNKNPSVKAETLLFLARSYQQSSPAMLPKPYLKVMCPQVVQRLDDTTPQVRDAACEVLGTLLKLLGERPMVAYVENIDKTKMAKITEFKEKVELKTPVGVPAAPAPAAAPAPSSAPASSAPETTGTEEPAKPVKKKPPVRKAKKKPEEGGSGESGGGEGAPAKKPAEKKPPAAKTATAKPAAAAGGGGGGKGKAKGGAGAVGKFDEPPDQPEPNVANEEVEEKAAEVLPSGLLEQLANTNWKERLAGHEQFKEFVEGLQPQDMQSLLFVKVLARKPGWKDSNFQVMKAKFAVICVLAEKAAVFGKKSTAACLSAAVDKLGDIKVKGQSGELLLAIAERMTLNYTSIQVLKHAMDQKSPKVQSESLDWLGSAVKEFGFLLNMKPHVDFIKKAFTATNPAVRTAAINLLGTLHMYLGAQLRMFFEDEKPAILQQIDAAFEKVAGETAPAPTRGPNVRSAEEEGEEEVAGGGGGGGAAAPAMSLADLMPKVDISGQIKSDLIKELGDKNWKVRGEALQKVQGIIAAAKFVQPSLGDLPGALKGRLGDSNKNLIVVTLGIIGSLATAMGSSCTKYNKVFMPGVLSILADAKPQLRAAAISCLNAWWSECTLVPLVEQEILSTSLATENPNLRTELLGWLEEKLPSAGKLPTEAQSLTPPLFSCLEDRSAEVRKKSQAVLPHLMAHVGYDVMVKQAGKLKPASKQVVKPLLDKHRVAAQPKSAPAQPSSSSSTSPSKAAAKEPAAAQTSPPKADAPAKKSKQAASKGAGKTATAKGGGGGGDEEPLLVLVAHGKEQRMKDEEKLKSLKWNFQMPRQEHIDQLKDQLTPCISRSLHAQLFHDNFKQHLAALTALTKTVKVAEHCEAVVSCLDLLLRWVTLRFFDTNTTVNMKCLEFLHVLFESLVEGGYRMSDYEATSFLPYLVQKVGDSKDPVRKEVRLLFRELCSFYPPNKLFNHIMDGLKSRNARLRTECLEALGELIQNNGMSVCQPGAQKTLPLIAGQISDRDNGVRSAALNAMVVVYGNIGESVYKYTSQLPEKEISLLEERIKRSGKKFLPAAPPAVERETSPAPSSSSTSSSYDIAPDPRMMTLTRPRGHKPLPVEDEVKKSPSPPPQAPSLVAEEAPPIAPPTSRLPTPTTSGRFKLDMSKYTPRDPGAKARVQPKLAKPDLSCFEGAIPTLSSSSLLASPPKPVVFTPIRLASHSSAINYIISQINSADYDASVQALKQLENIAASPDQWSLLKPHVDQLIRSVLMQMRINFSTNLSRATTPAEQQKVMEMGRHLTAILDTVFSVKELAYVSTQETLVEVERDIFGYLVDERLLRLAEVAQLNRAYNQLMSNVVGNSSCNAAFGSLLQVMLETLAADGSSTKMSEMPMKCIWRLTRCIPTLLPSLNVDQLLLDVHRFYEGHAGLNSSFESKPCRTAKTILFHLASNMEQKVLDHLTLIPDPRESQVTQYLRKTLAKKRISLEKNLSTATTTSSSSSSSTMSTVTSSRGSVGDSDSAVSGEVSAFESQPLPTDVAIELTDILTKLRDPAASQQGLSELYDFKQKHTAVDIKQYFKTASLFFQGYIERGLKMVEEERSASSDSGDKIASVTTLHSDGLAQRERQLEATRLRASRVANIDWGDKTGSKLPVKSTSPRHPTCTSATTTTTTTISTTAAATPQDENKEPTSVTQPLPTATSSSSSSSTSRSVDLSALRKRLDRLKGSGQQ